MIAITFALPTESAEFLRRLRNKSRVARNGIVAIHGMIENRAVEVLHTGVGAKVCRERITKFLQSQEFEFLISAGFAGALNDQLQVGDLLVAKNFSTVDLKQTQSSLLDVPIHAADLLTVPTLIDSTKERTKLARTSGAAAVDMETEFIARACAEHALLLLSLRVITDTPIQPFPAPPNVLFDIEQQRTDISAFAKFFLGHPNRIPALVKFARRIARARKVLASALVAIVNEL
jgi:adenosylhomocysteine nucleosidase